MKTTARQRGSGQDFCTLNVVATGKAQLTLSNPMASALQDTSAATSLRDDHKHVRCGSHGRHAQGRASAP